jgi:hypothetical protein
MAIQDHTHLEHRGRSFGPNRTTQFGSSEATGQCTLPSDEQALIREFMQALVEEIEAIKKGRGGSIITVHDGVFVRREGPFFVYVFSTGSPLIVMEDAPAEVEVGGQKFPGQIISVQGSDVAVGIENDFGKTIAQARLITDLSYLLETLRKRYEEVLNGERTLDTALSQRVFGLAPVSTQTDGTELNLPPSPHPPNAEQETAIRTVCGSDIQFIWGPPGTGKTQTIGFLIAALLGRNLRVLVVSHTNVATDNAIDKAARLLEATEDYHSGKLVRYGITSPNSDLPPMVRLDKITEFLGRRLKDQLAELQAKLQKVHSELKSLREVQTLLAAEKEALRRLADLETNLQHCSRECEITRSRGADLAAQLQETKVRLAAAEAAGRLKRFFLGLDPVKLQVEAAQTQRELDVALAVSAAQVARQNEVRAAMELARSERERHAREARVLLSRHGLDADGLAARVGERAKRSEQLTVAIRTVEAELEALRSKILREAKVIATSLTKATISKQMDDQKFDAIVVDEASMAPMPSLYFAAGRAAKKAIIVGDFRQLPPICLADTEIAQKWLGRDIFNQAGVQRAVDERKQEPRLRMLRQQYRMHPEISATSNGIIYKGRLINSLSNDTLHDINMFMEKSPFGHSPLLLYDVSSTNPWSSHLEQGGRYNLYSAVLSAELAKQATQAGVRSVGVISPYSVHARLIKMILEDSGDPQLRCLKVSTVHKFQGLEQDLIIFDIAEGPMPRYGPSGLVDGVDLGSQAAKLINVSITRPRAQIAVVANVQYLASKLPRDAILLQLLGQLQGRGTVVDSKRVVDDYFCSEFERWARLLEPRDDGINPNDGTLYTERNFYAGFFADLRKATKEIIIVSPFLTANRAQQFFNLFRSKLADGLELRVFTQTLGEQQGDMFRQAEMVFEELKRIGVQVVERRGLHQKFAFIDREVAWEGSLNILSQSEGRSTEQMRRLPYASTCDELIKLHNFGSDTEVAPGTRGPVRTDRKCDKCGSVVLLVPGPHGFFLGCDRYPECDGPACKSIGWGDRIGTDVKCATCGRPMVAVRGRYGVYLRCSDLNCKVTRSMKK